MDVVAESDEPMTAEAIASLRSGWSLQAVRRWLSRATSAGQLQPVGRDLRTGALTYDADEVRRAIDAMPGQGSRTDLHRPESDPCQSPPTSPPTSPPGSGDASP